VALREDVKKKTKKSRMRKPAQPVAEGEFEAEAAAEPEAEATAEPEETAGETGPETEE
jgi:hypothetical protein